MKRINPIAGCCSQTQRLVGLFVAVVIAYTQLFASVAFAQIEDNEDPVIIHRQADSPATAGQLQTFLARVYDDVEVIEVTLYYRQSAVSAFKAIPMRPLLDSLGEYMIALETQVSEYPGVQYYIEAVDSSGNVTNRGYSYAPIILPLTKPDPDAVAPPEPAPVISQAPPLSSPSSSGSSSSSLLLGVGALLLLGALAAGGGSDGGGGDGGSGGGGGGETPTPAITLTIISDGPSGN